MSSIKFITILPLRHPEGGMTVGTLSVNKMYLKILQSLVPRSI